MHTHEVTNQDFKRFVLANPQWQKNHIADSLYEGYYLDHWDNSNNYPEGKANHPVRYVSWYAAMAYANLCFHPSSKPNIDFLISLKFRENKNA